MFPRKNNTETMTLVVAALDVPDQAAVGQQIREIEMSWPSYGAPEPVGHSTVRVFNMRRVARRVRRPPSASLRAGTGTV